VANIAVQPVAESTSRRVSDLGLFMAVVLAGVMGGLAWLIRRSWLDYTLNQTPSSLGAVISMSLILAFLVSLTGAVIRRMIRNRKS
jgi:hypothetical protein